jgi:hypothetical protein
MLLISVEMVLGFKKEEFERGKAMTSIVSSRVIVERD